ncbi:MAG: hypothetical protein ACD_41C00206G0002 [uncultured bacterium]|nr:MAG: hypothetical protein ACD_41C00206G0002 [uncultured bacterium]HBY73467.1 hypothetical protein [Candidatus Kerfeldbacteria bacterium]
MAEAREPVRFTPKDWPDLWALTHGPDGIGRLRGAKQGDVVKMFLPRDIRGGVGLQPDNIKQLDLPQGNGKLEFGVQFGDAHQYGLHIEGYVEPATPECPQLFEVSDLDDVALPTHGGAQAFYQNLEYQLGHMDIPIIYGQKVPTVLGYFLHRVHQVPVGLLDQKFDYIRRRIEQLQPGAKDALRSFSQFSWTVGVYGETAKTLLDPRYRATLAQLEQQFNAWSQEDREVLYKPAIIKVFHLTEL